MAKADQSVSITHDERFSEQLSEVEDWIYQHEEVGTIASPGAWLHLRGEVVAANFTSHPHRSHDEPLDMAREAVIFAARDEDGNRLLLGGSGYHLTAAAQFGSSEHAMQQTLYYSMSVGLLRLFETYRDEIGHPVTPHDRPVQPDEAERLVARICDAIMSGRFLAQSLGVCDVLSKRLATYTSPAGVTTLATPLTVAMLD